MHNGSTQRCATGQVSEAANARQDWLSLAEDLVDRITEFVEHIKTDLGRRAADPEAQPLGAAFSLRDPEAGYGHVFQAKSSALSFKNGLFLRAKA